MSDNDVMQVAMSGHLLVEPNLSANQSDNAIPNRRLAEDSAAEDVLQATSTLSLDKSLTDTRRRVSDSTSSLEKFFDRQFNAFPMAGIPVDWSLRSDNPTEVR